MILCNKSKKMAYKSDGNIVMINNLLNNILDIDNRIIYALISNFEYGIELKNIYNIMEPKGMEREEINKSIDFLLDMVLIESVTHNIDLDKINYEFEKFKEDISKII